jgi:hypothetical protein
MKLAILLLAFVALPAYAAESQHDKDVAACKVEADNAVAKAVVKNPADVNKVKRDAFNICLRSKGRAAGTVREK